MWLIKWSAIDLRSKAREMKEALRKLSRCNRRFRPGQSVLEARMYPTTGCFKREGTISSLAIYSSRKTNSRPFLPLSFYDTSIARFVWWSVNGHCQLVYWFWTYKWSVTDRVKTYKWCYYVTLRAGMRNHLSDIGHRPYLCRINQFVKKHWYFIITVYDQ